MPSIAFANPERTKVALTDQQGRTFIVPLDWQGEFRQFNSVAEILAALGKTEPDPYVTPPPTADELRSAAFKADAARAALIAKLKTATPAQIDTYFAGRTTVAQIKADVVDIVKVLALAIRD